MDGLPERAITKSRWSDCDNVAEVRIMRHYQPMNGNKVVALSWWTFAYIIVAGALLTFSAMGDCLQGAEGAACTAKSNSFTEWLLVIEVLAYLILTWAMFFRRR